VIASDNSRAVATHTASTISHDLDVTDFVFSIPAGTINGIVVEVERAAASADTVYWNRVVLLKAGVEHGGDKSAGVAFPTSDAYETFGGISDVWGGTWTPDDINASTFGIRLRSSTLLSGGSGAANIDHVRITIYYTTNTAPTITAGPTTTYQSGDRTNPSVTWGVTFTPDDAEQTGANAITYYIRTSATFGAGTQVATGTCTADSEKAVTGLAYNATGLTWGSQTLYLHLYDGTANTATAGSFTLEVSQVAAVTGDTATATTAGQVGSITGQVIIAIAGVASTATAAGQVGAVAVVNLPWAAVTGTATASITETDINAGGKTIIITLNGTTWIAA
jgi:hypothetical protein